MVVISTRVVNGRRITVHDAGYAPASQCSSGRKIASRGKGIPWDFLHQRPYGKRTPVRSGCQNCQKEKYVQHQ